MRTFKHFDSGYSNVCPICKTAKDCETVLIPIPGTEDGGICEAQQMHKKCLDLLVEMVTSAPLSMTTNKISSNGWRPISSAPKDCTVIDIWRSGFGGKRCPNMVRADYGGRNVFYTPAESGPSCVRDATHWMPLPKPPNGLSDGLCHNE